MGWNRTGASNTSAIMARFWYIMNGIEIKKKKKKEEEELIKLIELRLLKCTKMHYFHMGYWEGYSSWLYEVI